MELKKGEYIKDGMEHGQWAVFYDSHQPGRYIVARYSRSEVRPYYELYHLLILDNN